MSDHGETTSTGAGAGIRLGSPRRGANGTTSGDLAAALGLQASGLRAAATLSGDQLIASLDLLAEAARRRLPLVVHLATGEDHRAYHAAASTGAIQLFAANAREAADLALIARRAAENALTPAVVAFDGAGTEAGGPALDAETVRRYLGRAGDVVRSPTPSQEMLFGRRRRRVPRWHDPERPLLTGARRGAGAEGPAALARRTCFEAHLPELLEAAFDAFAEETGRRYEALVAHRARGAKVLVVAQGAAVETAVAVADELRAGRGPKVGVVGIRALRPLAADRLAELLRGRRAVAVLERSEPAGGATTLSAEIRSLGEQEPWLTTAVYGLGGSPLNEADLAALCRELADRKADRRPLVYLGLGVPSAGGYPKRQAHLDALHRACPEIARLGLQAETPASEPQAASAAGVDSTLPAVVRRMAPSRSPLADLAGFADRAGAPGATGLIPDPFLASGTVPPFASALSAVALSAPETPSSLLPAFEPALCTGCGDCWSGCPDSAVGPLVIGPAALLDEGMRRAARRGRSVDKLRMVKSKLAGTLGRTMAAAEEAGGGWGEILDATFEPLIDKMKLPDERKAQVSGAFLAVREEIATMPVARTAPFFENGGDLFSLAIDPDACKGCGLCIAECEPRALTEAERSPERAAAARELWRLYEELPAPEDAAIERAGSHPDVGPLAGALLARPAREAMAAVHLEAGSGEALAARQVLGMATTALAPARRELLVEVEDLRGKLSAAIHEELSQALPDRDLDALARGLEALEQPDAELAELTERVETAFETERVDVPGTRRLVDAGRELADLAGRLEKGEGSLGRAPCAAVLAGTPAEWGGTFPDNPFAVPVTVATRGAAALARGLLEGQLAQTIEIVRVLRRARAELERAGARRGEEADAELGWGDLDAGERTLCPPLLLLASEAALAGRELGATLAALDTELPLKVFTFATASRSSAAGTRTVELALSAGRALVAQSSVAHYDHLGQALGRTFAHPGSAFVRILAPSPARGGFGAGETLERARAAEAGGELALMISDPDERAGRSLLDLLEPPAAPDEAEPEAAAPVAELAPALAVDVAELEQRHAAEMAALRGQYEAHVAQLRTGLKTEMAHQIRGKLMRLVAGARGADPEPGNGRSPEATSLETEE